MESVELTPMTSTLEKSGSKCMNEDNYGDLDSSPKPPSFIEQKSVSCNELRDSLEDTDDGEKKDRPQSKTKAMQKLKSSWLTGTKNLKKETASLLSTVGTWTNSILKPDKTTTPPSTEEQEKYFGLVEKKGNLAQKMKTLLKIGDEGKDSHAEKDTVSVVSQDLDGQNN